MISDTAVINNTIPSYLGDGASSIGLWGAQIEAGSNATSYIPTVATTSTRNADVISKTGISDLIGQTEGTLYAEVDLTSGVRDTSTGNGIIEVATGSTSRINSVTILKGTGANALLFGLRTSNANTLLPSIGNYINGINKIAVAYKSGDIAVYVNGISVYTSAISFTFSGALDALNLGNYGNSAILNDRIKSGIVWKERLTDEQCVLLTGDTYNSYSEMATNLNYILQ